MMNRQTRGLKSYACRFGSLRISGRLFAVAFVILVLILCGVRQMPAKAVSLQDEMAAELGVPEGEIRWLTKADTLGSFHFTSRSMYGEETFENEITVTGTAAFGSVLYMGTFIVEKGTVSLWESHITQVSQAGFVQEKLALPRTGENNYVIVVQDGDNLYGCVYRIERISARTAQKLIELRINLYEACMP